MYITDARYRCSVFRLGLEMVEPLVPYVLVWRRDYKWKVWLKNDFIAGFTIALMGIPQGLAYAKLANVEPVYGKLRRRAEYASLQVLHDLCLSFPLSQVELSSSSFSNVSLFLCCLVIRHIHDDVSGNFVLVLGHISSSRSWTSVRAVLAARHCCSVYVCLQLVASSLCCYFGTVAALGVRILAALLYCGSSLSFDLCCLRDWAFWRLQRCPTIQKCDWDLPSQLP